MKKTLLIPWLMPGLNEIIEANRTNRFAGAGQKKKEDQKLIKLITLTRFNKNKFEQVKIHFHWIEQHKRRDPDNIRAGAKFILDALVKSGVIPNDTQRYVKGLSDSYSSDKKNFGVEVTIMSIEKDGTG